MHAEVYVMIWLKLFPIRKNAGDGIFGQPFGLNPYCPEGQPDLESGALPDSATPA